MVAFSFLESLSPKHLSNAHFVDKLIRLYRANECLWNPKSPGYRNLALKDNAWHRISHFFDDELTIDQLKLAIISLRHYFEKERLVKERIKEYIEPRETYYQKLQFLEDTDMEMDNATAIETQPQLSNSQINCIVEDTFLLSDSQNSIHSEHVDFGLPFSLDEEYPITETLAFSEQYSVNFPFPPMEFDKRGLQIRALSGNDRAKSNYNGDEEYDDFRRKQSRSHSHSTKLNRNNSKYGVMSQTNIRDYKYETSSQPPVVSNGNVPKSQYDDWNGPQTSSPPKRKVLTGRYSKRSSRQGFTDYVYETKFNEIRQNNQYIYTPSPIGLMNISRKRSGEDEAFKHNTEENNLKQGCHPNSQSICPTTQRCSCCPNFGRNDQNQNQEDGCYEEDQVDHQNQNCKPSNNIQVQPESEYEEDQVSYQDNEAQPEPERETELEYLNEVPDDSQQHNEEFQSLEPSSEDYAPQPVPRKCCRKDTCPILFGKQTMSPRKEKPEVDEPSTQPKMHDDWPSNSKLNATYQQDEPARSRGHSYRNGSAANDSRRQNTQPLSEGSFDNFVPTSKAASRVASRNASKQVSRPASTYADRQETMISVQEPSHSPKTDPRANPNHNSEWNPGKVYCTRNLHHMDEAYKEKYVECHSKNRRPRRSIQEEPMDEPDVHERSNSRKNNSTPRAFQDNYAELPKERYVSSSSRNREKSRSHYEYEDTNSRRRHSFDPHEEYCTRNNDRCSSRRGCDDGPTKRSQTRSDHPDKHTARNTINHVKGKIRRWKKEPSHIDHPKSRLGSSKPRHYETTRRKYGEDEHSCYCSSDGSESMSHSDYVEQSIQEYPHGYADAPESQAQYPQAYAEGSIDEFHHGFAEEEAPQGYRREHTHEYAKKSKDDYPETYNQRHSREYRKDHHKKIREEYPDEYVETCNDYVQEYAESNDGTHPKGPTRDYCKDCCGTYKEEIHEQYPVVDYPENDEEPSPEYVEEKDTYKDENVELDHQEKARPSYCEAAVETEIDMTLNNRMGTLSESPTPDQDDNMNENLPKPTKATKKTKMPCKCTPQAPHKAKNARSSSAGQKMEILKQRSPSPMAGKSRMASMKRHHKLEDDMENKFQAYGGQQDTRAHRATGEPRPYERNVYRERSGLESDKLHATNLQSKQPDGMSILGSFQVPPILAEKTINIVKNHISNLATNDLPRDMNKSRPVQDRPITIYKETPKTSASCTGQTQKSKSPVNIASNPFRNINFDVSKGQIIILHPPVQNFRPSKYSFSLNDAAEVQQTETIDQSMKAMPALPNESKLTS